MTFSLKSDFVKIALLFLAWRTVLFICAYIAPSIMPFKESFPYYQGLIATGLPHFIWSFGNFDGVHYLAIAKNAYAFQYTQAFFPLYPLLIKFISLMTLGNFLLAGLLISNASFLISLFVFYKLLLKTSERKIALWSVVFLITFPTSFYFGSVYTESIFLLLILLSYYLLEKKRFLYSYFVGSFTSATRLVGLFLAPTLIDFIKKRNLLPLIIVPIGFIFYVIYLKIEFNNPLYFLTSQSIFGQERSTTPIVLLPQVFWRYIKILKTTNGLLFYNALLEISSTLFALVTLLFAYKKVSARWVTFSLMAILAPTLTGTLASMPRYILIAFPIYIVLARINSNIIKSAIAALFSVLLIILTILFSQGYWVA